MAEIRRLFTDRIGVGDIKIKTGLVGDGREMKHAVGRTAERHIHRERV